MIQIKNLTDKKRKKKITSPTMANRKGNQQEFETFSALISIDCFNSFSFYIS